MFTVILHNQARYKKIRSGVVKHSLGFMKIIVRMSATDRNFFLRILKKHKRKKKGRAGVHLSKAATDSNSHSSNNYISSVNHDWENWAHLHGKADVVAADVQSLGKVVGVKYQCDTLNSFNLLTREGRRIERSYSRC